VQTGQITAKISPVTKVTETIETGRKTLEVRDCGLGKYREILQLQHELTEKRRRDEIPNTALLVEHPPVITLGARQSFNKLLVGREELEKKHIDVVEIRRGGGTTAHNPGQLVLYPIMNLQTLKLGISEYVRKLEAIGAELLEGLGVDSTTRKGLPGLWIDKRKIASVGVRVSKFVTYHGMAINIQNELGIFDFIKPCGLEDIEMTSVLKETGKRHSMNHVKEELSRLLMRHFS
jgi:lipoyl(octanoyl) transferase